MLNALKGQLCSKLCRNNIRTPTHHAKLLHSESKVGPLSSRTQLRSFWCALGVTTSGVKVSHIPVHSLVRCVLSLRHEIQVLQATNAAEALQRGYESVRFLAWYSVFHCRAGFDEVRAKRRCRSIWYILPANLASWVDACAKIVGPFKHLLRVTAHPQFLVLELRVPMGACPRQYGTYLEASL